MTNYPTMTTIEKNSVNVGEALGADHLDTLIRTYKQQKWVHNSERLGKEDSLSVWFDIDGLEAFIKQVKEEGGNGVRMFFGAYPENYEQELLAGRQTLCMVATKEKNGKNKLVYANDDAGNTTVLSWGNGAPCPPFCDKPKGDPDPDGNIWINDRAVGITIVDKGEDGIVIV